MEVTIFKKTLEPFPERHHCLLTAEFRKLHNNKPVTLTVTKSKVYILYEHGTLKYCDIDFDLRFQLRSEMRLLHEGNDELTEHQERIFVLTFEKLDLPQIEFYNKNSSILNWRLQLSQMLNMLNYQHFYQMDKLLGQGSFASVYAAKRKQDNELFAAKAFFKKMLYQSDPKAKAQIQNEILMLRLLSDHAHITKLFEVYENQAQIHLIIELCQGGNLEDFMAKYRAPLPEHFAKSVFNQIVLAIQYMHSRGIMHRDVKPANIMFRFPPPLKPYLLENHHPSVVLSDLGISTPVDAIDHIYQKCGSPGYMAPEVFKTQEYSEKVDIFGLGALLYEMLRGHRIYNGKTREEIIASNQAGVIDFEEIKSLGEEVSRLIASMLNADPLRRPSATQILSYSWFDENKAPKRPRPKSSPPKKQMENQLPNFRLKLNVIGPIKATHPEVSSPASKITQRQSIEFHRDLSPVIEEKTKKVRHSVQLTQSQNTPTPYHRSKFSRRQGSMENDDPPTAELAIHRVASAARSMQDHLQVLQAPPQLKSRIRRFGA